MKFEHLNQDCLLLIISYLSLSDQHCMAQCSTQFNALCLNESVFKRHVKTKFKQFDYDKIYRSLKSWKLTALYLYDLTLPVEILVYEVLPQWIFRLSKGYIWTDIFPGSVYEDYTLQEAIYLVECYQTVFRQLMCTPPCKIRHETFWNILYPAWQHGPKTEMWTWENEHEMFGYGVPAGRFLHPGSNNMGFYVRAHIQDALVEERAEIVNQTMDIVQVPRSLPSVRNLLLKVISQVIIRPFLI